MIVAPLVHNEFKSCYPGLCNYMSGELQCKKICIPQLFGVPLYFFSVTLLTMLEDITNTANAKKRKLTERLLEKYSSVSESSNADEDEVLIQELEAMGDLVSPVTTYRRMLAFTNWECWCSIQFAKTKISAYNSPWTKEALTLSKYRSLVFLPENMVK